MILSQFAGFSCEKESQYIIINTDHENCKDEIEQILKKIKADMLHDYEYAELFIGLGNTYSGLDGLKRSHEEALESITIAPKQRPQLRIYSPKTIKYIFNTNDETELFNALVSNDTEKALNIIQSSVKKNERIDSRSLKQFYSQILNIILKAAKIKNIQLNEDNKYDFEICFELLNKPTDEIYRKILSILDLFTEKSDKKESMSRMIIEYINENCYDNNLSLNYIAQTFNITVSYLSILLKNSLGTGFHDYLNNLRINEAKRLLIQTNDTMQTIYTKTGFNNKQTFTRVFKSIVGVTPSYYKKNNGNR